MIKITLQPEKPLTDKEIKIFAQNNNLLIKREIRKGKQYIHLYINEKNKAY